MRLQRVLLAVLALAAAAAPAGAVAPEADLCRGAAVEAARRHGVPEDIMLGITLIETRRRANGSVGPWPWTVNVAGQGFWFESRAEARAHAEATLAAGQRSFDVGCFQLNYRWHGAAFTGIDAMFEPALAADYAARFLSDLHAESGDWMRAAGHYHSRTPVHSERYRRLLADALGSDALTGGRSAADFAAAAAPAPEAPRRATGGPLLAAATGPLIALAAAPPGAARSTTPGTTAGAIGFGALTAGRPLALGARTGPAVPLIR